VSATIEVDQGVHGGDPVFGGTRIPLRKVLVLLEAGRSPADVLLALPTLPDGWLELVSSLKPVLRRRYRGAIVDANDQEGTRQFQWKGNGR